MDCLGKPYPEKCPKKATKTVIYRFTDYDRSGGIEYHRAEIRAYCPKCYAHLRATFAETGPVTVDTEKETTKTFPSVRAHGMQEVTIFWCTETDI